MAEIKIYACDVCPKIEARKREAKRITIPHVDQIDGRIIHATVDLCFEHMTQLNNIFFETTNTDQHTRRTIWKRILELT
jgi:hypothetical protein